MNPSLPWAVPVEAGYSEADRRSWDIADTAVAVVQAVMLTVKSTAGDVMTLSCALYR